MRSQRLCSHFATGARVFGLVASCLLGVVIGGDQFEREGARSKDREASADSAKHSRAVLQDGSDWLSEEFWKRRRSQQFGYFSPRSNPFAVEEEAGRWGRSSEPLRDRELYRTVCVRLCDGYYFPISFSTTRDRFARDDRACRSRCSSEAHLFYHSTSDPNADDLKDRNGRLYRDLENAFVYRATYNRLCRCRPDPWSEEARQRHAMYATEDWQETAKRLARGDARGGHLGEPGASWRIVAPASEDGDGMVETAAEGADVSLTGLRPDQSSPMSLGRTSARAAPVPRPSFVHRRNRDWRTRVFNTGPDGN